MRVVFPWLASSIRHVLSSKASGVRFPFFATCATVAFPISIYFGLWAIKEEIPQRVQMIDGWSQCKLVVGGYANWWLLRMQTGGGDSMLNGGGLCANTHKHAARCAGRVSGAFRPLHGRLAGLVQQQSWRRVPGDCTEIATSGGRLSVLTVTPP